MAEASSSTAPTVENNGSSKDKRKKGGLITFIKKNKTLSAVAGVGGLYFLYKMNAEKSESSVEPEGEVSEISSEGGALAGTAQAAAFELGRSERLAEQSHSEVEEIEEEREEERRRVKEKGREKEEEEVPGTGESPGVGGGGTSGGEAEPTTPGGITVHGKTFSGANSSHIAKTGKTSGGKAYVEYAIQFPGRVEHWQYFTATGNWRRVADSSSGGGANKPGPGTSPSPNRPPAGGPATGSDRKKNPPKTGIGQNKPVSTPAPAPRPPSTNPVHPQAVNTGNKCVNGGVGGHTAPPGYHLFCQNGWIWRAPN